MPSVVTGTVTKLMSNVEKGTKKSFYRTPYPFIRMILVLLFEGDFLSAVLMQFCAQKSLILAIIDNVKIHRSTSLEID